MDVVRPTIGTIVPTNAFLPSIDGRAPVRALLVTDRAGADVDLPPLLAKLPGINLLETASYGSCFRLTQIHCPQVAVVDGCGGFAAESATERLLRASAQVRILIVSDQEELPALKGALRAGAQGYLLQPIWPSALLHAIRAVAAGGTYIDPALARLMVDDIFGLPLPPDDDTKTLLSPREFDVLRLLAKGYGNKEIAARMTVGVKSVETYKARAMDKLSLRSRADLVQFALRKGWLART